MTGTGLRVSNIGDISEVNYTLAVMSQPSRPCTQLLTLLMFASVSYAQPPDRIFGVYTYLSRTCGGPSSADGPADCGLVFEDKLEIAPNISLDAKSANTVHVSFGLHNERMDACLFSGEGTWSKARLVLDRGERPTAAYCQLSLTFSKGVARLSDPGHKCRPSLCFGSGRPLNGVAFTKQQTR